MPSSLHCTVRASSWEPWPRTPKTPTPTWPSIILRRQAMTSRFRWRLRPSPAPPPCRRQPRRWPTPLYRTWSTSAIAKITLSAVGLQFFSICFFSLRRFVLFADYKLDPVFREVIFSPTKSIELMRLFFHTNVREMTPELIKLKPFTCNHQWHATIIVVIMLKSSLSVDDEDARTDKDEESESDDDEEDKTEGSRRNSEIEKSLKHESEPPVESPYTENVEEELGQVIIVIVVGGVVVVVDKSLFVCCPFMVIMLFTLINVAFVAFIIPLLSHGACRQCELVIALKTEFRAGWSLKFS